MKLSHHEPIEFKDGKFWISSRDGVLKFRKFSVLRFWNIWEFKIKKIFEIIVENDEFPQLRDYLSTKNSLKQILTLSLSIDSRILKEMKNKQEKCEAHTWPLNCCLKLTQIITEKFFPSGIILLRFSFLISVFIFNINKTQIKCSESVFKPRKETVILFRVA